MLRFSTVAALVWAFCATAAAQIQSPTPVAVHYRAYLAALEAGDLVRAEAEAEAAFAASETSAPGSGRTGVLALNLANVRLQRGEYEDARQAARRALAISQTLGESQSDVPPALAQLILARAELGTGDVSAASRLAAAIEAAQRQRLPPAEIHDAAAQLGAWSFRHERFSEALSAWSIATEYAEGSRFGEAYGRADALTGQAAALLLNDVEGRRRGARFTEEAALEAYAMLSEAIRLAKPLAEINSDGEVTHAQQSYARALAWRAVLRAKLGPGWQNFPEAQEAQGDADGLSEVDLPPPPETYPRCLVHIRPNGARRLIPEAALVDGMLAGMAVRFRIDAAGELTDIQTLARVGPEEFDDTVGDRRAWRVERREDSPPNCRMAMSVIQSIAFSTR